MKPAFLRIAAFLALALCRGDIPARGDDPVPVPSGPGAGGPPAVGPRLELPAPKPHSAGVVVRRDLAYGQGSGRSLHLDFYSPEKAASGPLPIVLWIHGGGWVAGNKNPCGTVGLVERGYATASVEYRFAGEAVFPAQIEDCKAAVRWVRAHAKELGVDGERIGVAGASAGGHLAALLGVAADSAALEGAGGCGGVSSAVHAVCDIFGPTDLLKFDGHGSVIVAADDTSVIAQLLGGSIASQRARAIQASPVTWVTEDDPPFLIVHGDKDNVVPLDQSRIFDAALSKAGVDSTLIVVKGVGHSALPADVNAKISAFFDAKLKARRAKPAAGGASKSGAGDARPTEPTPPAAPVAPAMAGDR